MKPIPHNSRELSRQPFVCHDARIAICCPETNVAERYVRALKEAGFLLARPTSAESLASPRAVAGVIDLLVCDVDAETLSTDARHWQALLANVQPKIGAIAVTSFEDPRWIIKCIRRGALNCHLSSDSDEALVEMIDECLGRHAAGLDNLKTVAERRHARLAARLREAIAQEQIEIHFQPIVNSGNWRCERVEALARWNDPDLGPVPPSEFVPTAEAEDLIEDLGLLVLRKSLEALAALRQRGHRPIASINVSRRQFENPNLVSDYLQLVKASGEDPGQFIIEVTETAKFENYTLALSLMRDFIEAGFSLAVDDFGTGESSFVQMSHVAYKELKIDRSLVSCIFEPAGLSIMQSIIAMAKSLDMHLVAEGVEDKETAELLDQLEIDFCQGFYFARPMPLPGLIQFLDGHIDGASSNSNLKPQPAR